MCRIISFLFSLTHTLSPSLSLLQNWHAIISSTLASLLLLSISTLIAIALVIHTEVVPKKYLQMGSKSGTPTKRRESVNNIISSVPSPEAVGPGSRASNGNRTRSRQLAANAAAVAATGGGGISSSHGAAGIRGAIGISWLLPLLFAIASPLICSIIGKWPRHWWLELLWTRPTMDDDGAGTGNGSGTGNGHQEEEFDADVYYATHTLLNGDNLLLESETLLGNATSRRSPPTTEASASVFTSITSTSDSIGGGFGLGLNHDLSPVTAAASTWPHQQQQQQQLAPPVAWSRAPLPAHEQAAAFTSGVGGTSATGAASPSLSFILFICIDLLFILLFFALFVILMKKLLWLWHKNRNVHTHPLDKFNMALCRR